MVQYFLTFYLFSFNPRPIYRSHYSFGSNKCIQFVRWQNQSLLYVHKVNSFILSILENSQSFMHIQYIYDFFSKALTWARSIFCRGWGRRRTEVWWRSRPGCTAGTWTPACRWRRWSAWRSRPWTARSRICRTKETMFLKPLVKEFQ